MTPTRWPARSTRCSRIGRSRTWAVARERARGYFSTDALVAGHRRSRAGRCHGDDRGCPSPGGRGSMPAQRRRDPAMKGIVFLGERELELREFPEPTPGPGEVVIAIKGSGMCGSDLHPYRASRSGRAAVSLGLGGKGSPVIAGHEPCGVVALRGPGVPEAAAPPGARVMNHHYKGCGYCKHCRLGWSQLCRSGIVVYGMTGHGGHAPHMLAPAGTRV